MPKARRIDRCMGRVEFRACEDEILDMHKKGYANKHIYDKLVKDGKISLAYSTFNGHLRKLLQPKDGNFRNLLQSRKTNQPQNKSVDSVGKKESFSMPSGDEAITGTE
ncbi:TraK family protein [Solidesulfovibrio carbinolicus]|uniref:TraK family protein n=1 Tax=Solidesulfovibrio carbinolicus TaxID=296842 RepID=UPI0013E9EA83|nr:TraK family protein [Solidesulfovibrio carbinolicus]